MNPLNSVPAGIISGVVLAIIVFVIMPGSGFNELSLARWLHILSGVMWVGLLYYVAVAQIPALAAAEQLQHSSAGVGSRGFNLKYGSFMAAR
jgi:predicted transporter